MRTSPLGIVTLMALVAASFGGQQPSTSTWSGIMRSQGATRQLSYRVPTTIKADRFEIIGDLPQQRVRERTARGGTAPCGPSHGWRHGFGGQRRVQAACRTGRLQAPPAGAMAYMLSRYAWTADAETGKAAFIGPHLHFYTPGLTNARIGVDFSKALPPIAVRVENEGSPDASTIVAVRVRTPERGSAP